MVSDKFLSELPPDPMLALTHIVVKCEKTVADLQTDTVNLEAELIKLFALSETIQKKYSISIVVSRPQLSQHARNNIQAISEYFAAFGGELDKINAQNLLNASLARFERELDVGFHYEFSEGETARLQTLVNELREGIRDAKFLEEDHRRRLLARLEKLQAELHKRVPDLDIHLGTMVQIAAAIGQASEEAKPLVDRMREFLEIVAGVFRRAENLPPGPEFPLLPKSYGSDE